MEDSSMSLTVPAVDKAEPGGDPAPAAAGAEEKELLCPICMQIINDAFLTSCGHSFCYMCIVTHLQNKSDCPCCAQFLTPSQLYPNFLLNKLLKKTSAHQLSRIASPVEQFRQSLEQTGLSSVSKGVRFSSVSSGREKEKIGTRRSREKHANSAGLLTLLKESKS